jgi:hypothetical protein
MSNAEPSRRQPNSRSLLLSPVNLAGLTPNADGPNRRVPRDSAVSVRLRPRVGRITDALRYLHAAFLLQRLLQFYPERPAMPSRSATRNCQVGVRSVAEAPSWLDLCHVGSGRRRKAPSCLASERSGGAKQLTCLSFDGGSFSRFLCARELYSFNCPRAFASFLQLSSKTS